MRKLFLIVAVAATVLLLDSGMASARGCRGGRRGGRGGCGGGGCYSGGCGYSGGYGGGCYSGGCGYGGGYGGGCATCGVASTGYASGYCASCALVGVPQKAALAGRKATIIVQLPADARLTIDDEPTTSTSGRRVFVTPDLKAGKTFHYNLKAKINRGGKVLTVSRRIEVESGKITQITLPFPPTTTVAAK